MRYLAVPFLVVVGCATARSQPESTPPGSPPTTVPEADRSAAASGDDPGAVDFRAATTKLAAGDGDGAQHALYTFLSAHPQHALAPTAVALIARITLARGDAAGARGVLEGRAPGSRDPGVLFMLGVAESRLGRGDRALSLLRPFEISGPPALGGTADDETELLLRTALADAYTATGELVAALEQWDRYHGHRQARAHEKEFARGRAEELAGRVPPEAAVTAMRSADGALTRALLASKAAGALRTRGDLDGAKRLDEEAMALRRQLGFETPAASLGPGDPMRLGLAVPLSGREQRLGEIALRGAMMAIGEPLPDGRPPGFRVLVRDAAAGAPAPVTAALTREEAVIGIVGVGDASAIQQTSRDGVPFVVLGDQAPGAQSTAFQLLHTADERAVALAQRALAAGAKQFAILGPDSPGGLRSAEAFKGAVLAGGGRVVVHKTYAAGATSFSAPVAELRRHSFDAVFVPDAADRLELIAPALGVAEIWSRGAAGTAARGVTPGRREILLLSTAASLSTNLIRNAGKFVQGALLAPGYFASERDPTSAGFISRFRTLYGQDPSATDAYFYDGARLLRAAVERGARTRAEVTRMLAADSFQGVTGAVRFGPDHTRIDPPLVYVVEGDAINPAR